jgi:ABC-type amino acid transport substrate-binding protein
LTGLFNDSNLGSVSSFTSAPAGSPRTWPRLAVTATAAVTLLLSGCGSETASTGSGSQGETLTVGSDLTYPPYAYLEGTTPAGFDPDITAALAEKMGMAVSYEDTRFAQLIPGLNADQFDVIASALYITKERAAEVDYIPYFSTGNSIVVRKDDPPLRDAAALCGQRVSVIAGGDIVQKLRTEASDACTSAGKDPVDVREFPTDPEATQALISGQVEAQVTDAAVASTLEENTGGGVQISSTELLYPIPVGLAVKKGDDALAKKITDALETMRADGSYDTLLEKYNLAPPDQAQVDEILGS